MDSLPINKYLMICHVHMMKMKVEQRVMKVIKYLMPSVNLFHAVTVLYKMASFVNDNIFSFQLIVIRKNLLHLSS